MARALLDTYTLQEEKLIAYGFVKNGKQYVLKQDLDENLFVVFTIGKDQFDTQVFDKVDKEPYILYQVKNAVGAYVGEIRDKVETLKQAVLVNCFESNALRQEIINYIKSKYQVDIAYPWEGEKTSGTFKNSQGKWFGLIMKIACKSLGIEGEEKVDVLNLKEDPLVIEKLIDHKNFFPAYHMNKKYWLTILLDNHIKMSQIEPLIDDSYQLVSHK